MLILKERWVWDSWYYKDGDNYHCFFLQADRSLVDPEKRHLNASIGHAVSKDLTNWEILPDAISPTKAPAWDDNATWTGSVIKDPKTGIFHMFYTGVNHAEKGLIQRVGHATSGDLITWVKDLSSPIAEADAKYYEKLNLPSWHDEAWRDPWVFFNAIDGKWHMFVTARHNQGDTLDRATVGHLISSDLSNWSIEQPLTGPTGFGQLEVLQIEQINGKFVLIFCVALEHIKNPMQHFVSGTYSAPAETTLGPFDLSKADLISAEYAGRVVQGPDGVWNLLGFIGNGSNGEFVGAISDPIPLSLTPNGTLKPVGSFSLTSRNI